MSQNKTISSALISVFSKDGLEPIVKKLNEQGVTIYSTGGTQKFINDLGIDVVPVEDITDYPSILGGRVKTLHPKIFGGILNRQDNPSDVEEMNSFNIPQIDLVIVDLYPFEKTVASGAIHQLRDRTLHAIGHLMLPNSGQDFRIAKLLILVLIEGAQSVELSSAICRGDAARIVQIQNGISLTAQQDALMI